MLRAEGKDVEAERMQLAEIESRRLADEGIAFDLAEITLRVAQAFQPDLEELSDGQVAGTPAQVLALTALESLSDEEQAEES